MTAFFRSLARDALPIVAAMLLSRPAGATTMRLAAPEELVALSDVVVVAQVEQSNAAWQGGRIVTVHQVAVEQSWKGPLQSGQSLRVETLGGVIGTIGQHVGGAAQLTDGERVVLFLARTQAGTWRSVGMWQGVFHIDASGDRQTIYRTAGDSRITGVSDVPFPTDLEGLRWTTEVPR